MNRLLILCIITLALACSNANQQTPVEEKEKIDQETLKSELNQLEAELRSSESSKIDKKKANLLIAKSIKYVKTFPKDSESPAYLFRAAEVCVGIKELDKALNYFEKVKNDYPTHDKAPIALFLQGFTCENNTKEKEKAKGYYRDFLAKYPNHPLAEQIKVLLKNIDVSPEDLIKSFQKKRQAGE